MNYRKYLAVGWALLPFILGGVIVLLLWNRPEGGGGAVNSDNAIVAGKGALTDEAEEWTPSTLECPPPLPGQERVKVVYRDPPQEEVDRLARKYAAQIVQNSPQTPPQTAQGGVSGSETPNPATEPSKPSLGLETAFGAFRVVFGEYTAPALPYGGEFLSGVGLDGEFKGIFSPAPPPKFRAIWVYGGGGAYDITSTTGTSLDELRRSELYVFLEPIQTKRVYWRLEGGVQEGAEKWGKFARIKAEWRSDPWVRKSKRGLQVLTLKEK